MSELSKLMELPEVRAEISYGHIALITKFVHSELAATIPGGTFVGRGEDYWKLPLTWTTLVCLTNSFGEHLKMSDELVKWANAEYEYRVKPILDLRTGEGEAVVTDELLAQVAALCPESRSPLPSSVDPVERRYQVSGALLLATAKRFLLLDEQGTGKMTEVAIALSLYPDTLPALIVAPASTLYSWQRELAMFGIDAEIIDGTAAQRRKSIFKFQAEDGPKVAVCSYGILAKHSHVLGYGNIKLSDDHRTPKELNEVSWQTVVADEVHRAKSPKAVQTRALWAVSSRAEYRWGTTGTPVEQSPLDFWALLHFVDPESFSSKVKFQDRWVDYRENWFGGIDVLGIKAERLEEWRQISELYWRRKMSTGLPPVEPETRYCVLKGKHLTAYNAMAKQLMAEVGEDDAVLFAENHMVKAGRLVQLANSYVDVEEVFNEETGETDVIVTPIEPSPKLDLLMDTLEDISDPCILWFSHVKFMRLAQERLSKAGIDHVVIDGSMSSKARDNSVVAFQEGKVDLILISIAAGSEGITLTRAPISINVQRPDSLIMDRQKSFRNRRIGSEIHDVIKEIDLVTMGTIEEDQITAKERKVDIHDQVIDPNATS